MAKKNKSLYIMMSNTGSVLTRAIKLYTKTPYNHVSIVLDEELTEIYSFGRKFTRVPIWGGFVREYKDKGTYAYFKNTTCMVWKIDVDEVTYDRIVHNLEGFKRLSKVYYYNFLGIFFVLFQIPIKLPYGYVCSHFVADILEKSGVKLFDKKSSLISTVDFYALSENHEVVYEGRLCDYDVAVS